MNNMEEFGLLNEIFDSLRGMSKDEQIFYINQSILDDSTKSYMIEYIINDHINSFSINSIKPDATTNHKRVDVNSIISLISNTTEFPNIRDFLLTNIKYCNGNLDANKNLFAYPLSFATIGPRNVNLGCYEHGNCVSIKYLYEICSSCLEENIHDAGLMANGEDIIGYYHSIDKHTLWLFNNKAVSFIKSQLIDRGDYLFK